MAFHLDTFPVELPIILSRISGPIAIAWAIRTLYIAATLAPVFLARRK